MRLILLNIFKWLVMVVTGPAILMVVAFDCATDKDWSRENIKKNFYIIFPWEDNKYNTQKEDK